MVASIAHMLATPLRDSRLFADGDATRVDAITTTPVKRRWQMDGRHVRAQMHFERPNAKPIKFPNVRSSAGLDRISQSRICWAGRQKGVALPTGEWGAVALESLFSGGHVLTVGGDHDSCANCGYSKCS